MGEKGMGGVADIARLAALAAIVACAPARADEERGWRIVAGALSVDANLDVPDPALPPGVSLSSDDSDTGWSLAARYRFTRRLEAELGYLDGGDATVDLDAQILTQSLRIRSSLGFEAVVGALDVHLRPDRKVQVYAGPVLAFLHFGDVRQTLGLRLDPAALPLPVPLPALLSLLPELPFDPAALLDRPLELSLGLPGVDVDDEFAVGIGAGIDVPLDADGRWAFNGAVRYFASSVKGPLDTEVDLEPLLLGAGLSYRF